MKTEYIVLGTLAAAVIGYQIYKRKQSTLVANTEPVKTVMASTTPTVREALKPAVLPEPTPTIINSESLIEPITAPIQIKPAIIASPTTVVMPRYELSTRQLIRSYPTRVLSGPMIF